VHRQDSGFYRTTAPDVMLSIIDKIIVFDNSYGLGLFGSRLESAKEQGLGGDGGIVGGEELRGNGVFEKNDRDFLENLGKSVIRQNQETGDDGTRVADGEIVNELENGVETEGDVRNVGNLGDRVFCAENIKKNGGPTPEQTWNDNFKKIMGKMRFSDPSRTHKVYPSLKKLGPNGEHSRRVVTFDFRNRGLKDPAQTITSPATPNSPIRTETETPVAEPATNLLTLHQNPPLKNPPSKLLTARANYHLLYPSWNSCNIYDLRDSCMNNEFVFLTDLIMNFFKLFDNILTKKPYTILEKVMLSMILHKSYDCFSSRSIKGFMDARVRDLTLLLDLEKTYQVESSDYPRVPRCARAYHE
jgi:hypothetical protein